MEDGTLIPSLQKKLHVGAQQLFESSLASIQAHQCSSVPQTSLGSVMGYAQFMARINKAEAQLSAAIAAYKQGSIGESICLIQLAKEHYRYRKHLSGQGIPLISEKQYRDLYDSIERQRSVISTLETEWSHENQTVYFECIASSSTDPGPGMVIVKSIVSEMRGFWD